MKSKSKWKDTNLDNDHDAEQEPDMMTSMSKPALKEKSGFIMNSARAFRINVPRAQLTMLSRSGTSDSIAFDMSRLISRGAKSRTFDSKTKSRILLTEISFRDAPSEIERAPSSPDTSFVRGGTTWLRGWLSSFSPHRIPRVDSARLASELGWVISSKSMDPRLTHLIESFISQARIEAPKFGPASQICGQLSTRAAVVRKVAETAAKAPNLAAACEKLAGFAPEAGGGFAPLARLAQAKLLFYKGKVDSAMETMRGFSGCCPVNSVASLRLRAKAASLSAKCEKARLRFAQSGFHLRQLFEFSLYLPEPKHAVNALFRLSINCFNMNDIDSARKLQRRAEARQFDTHQPLSLDRLVEKLAASDRRGIIEDPIELDEELNMIPRFDENEGRRDSEPVVIKSHLSFSRNQGLYLVQGNSKRKNELRDVKYQANLPYTRGKGKKSPLQAVSDKFFQLLREVAEAFDGLEKFFGNVAATL